jgi:hypothetical protein
MLRNHKNIKRERRGVRLQRPIANGLIVGLPEAALWDGSMACSHYKAHPLPKSLRSTSLTHQGCVTALYTILHICPLVALAPGLNVPSE